MTEKQSQLAEISFDQNAIASRWYEAIAPIVPALGVAEAKPQLTTWTQQAADLLLAEPLEREKAQAIGKALARDISAEAQVLGRTQKTLAQQFTRELSAEQVSTLQPRLIELLSELAIGFILGKEELVRSMRAEFLSTTSHELRSPLNAIIGFSRVIIKEVDGPITDLQRQDLTAVYEGGKKLLDMINNTFNIEKIEVSKVEFESKAFHVGQLVETAIARVRPIADEYGNTLEVHHTADPDDMHSDPDIIRQALVNLLAYAAKLTRQGIIKLTTSRDVTDGVAWIRLRIADTGLGMTPAQIQRFTQGGDPDSLKYGDIELTVSQRYCQMLGGQIGVESEVGKGTTFTVSLPARRE